MSWSLNGRPIKRVLVTRLRYLGDIIMSTVLVQALKAGDPDVQIDYLCESEYGAVLKNQPGLDVVHRLDSRRQGSDADARVRVLGDDGAFRTWEMIRRLRSGNYDLAVDLFFNPRSAWLLRLAGIPLRIGGTGKWRRWLYTHSVYRDDSRCVGSALTKVAPGGLGDHVCRLAPLEHGDHGTGFMTWLAHRFGPGELHPEIARPPLDRRARNALESIDCDPVHPFLVVGPGATWPTKQWPLFRWREFLDACLSSTTMPVAILLPPGRDQEWDDLRQAVPPGRGGVLPALPLASALAVVGSAKALVSVDGGIMHAAVAMGVPTVAIFGPTAPGIWFPYTGRPAARVVALRPPCHPCDLHECPEFICLPELPAQLVLETLDAVMTGQGDGLA